VIPEEVKQYIRGYYGKPPAPIDPEVQRKAIGDEQPITCRPPTCSAPVGKKAKAEIGDLAKSEEDVLSYALFPQSRARSWSGAPKGWAAKRNSRRRLRQCCSNKPMPK